MKVNITILMLFVLSWNAISQSKIIGSVVYLNSGKTPAVGVEIKAKGSSGDYSKSEGDYILNFPHNKAGTTVYPEIGNEIVLNGTKIKKIELVNADKLEAVNIPSDASRAPLKIIVCPKGFRDEAAKKYYNIIRTEEKSIIDKKNRELIAIKEKLGASHNLVINLQDEIAHLKTQTNDSLKIYKEALEIASINRDDANQRVIDFLDALDAGIQIEEARKVLNTKKAFKEIVESEHKMQAGLEEIERDAKSLENLYRFKEAIQKYDTLSLLLRKKIYNPILLVKNLHKVGLLRHMQNFNEMAILNYKEALSILNNHKESNGLKAQVLNNLGTILSEQNQFSKAIDKYSEAIIIQRKLTQENSNRYSLDLINSLNGLGDLYSKIGESNKALNLYAEALQICKYKVQGNPKMYLPDLANTLNNIGSLYISIQQYSLALNYIETALKIRKELVINDRTQLAVISTSLMNLGLIYQGNNEIKLAIEKYEEALLILREQALDNPLFSSGVASLATELGLIYQGEQKDSELAPEKYKEALIIYNKLSLDNPIFYNILIGKVCYNFSILKIWQLKKKFDPTVKKEGIELINQGKKALEIYDNSNQTKLKYMEGFESLENLFMAEKK
ncbi:tetratricopeptide repeat protein [uncultured Lutibacter sp.]|uniref:tetratricopeptide repeat protein n=1 Tax=uncultured Lutibacter sp. TaxID=437739 RepID=UPI00260F17A2|nr:tetratricopeptide repeat protein [uncultured Lutibacter sp.]